MENNCLLEVKEVSAAYNQKEILHSLSFSLYSHELTALLGINGVGKSMLMKCIAQRLPHSGQCHLGSVVLESLSTRSVAQKIAYIPQRSSIQLSLTALDVVLMGFNPQLTLLERPSKKQKEQALAALTAVGLGGQEEKNYQTFSEGQKQLLYLARTMVEGAQLLLLDEAESALDFSNRYRMIQKLEKLLQSEEKAALLCLHDPQLALEFCDRLILLKDGTVFQELELQKSSPKELEAALQQLYGAVEVVEHYDRQGKRHLLLLWEDETWNQ